MSELTHPAALIELGRVGDEGLPIRPDPGFREEIDLCRRWGFDIETAGDRFRLRFDDEQLISQWIQKETPPIAWDTLRAEGFLSLQSTNTQARLLAERGAPGGTLVFAEEQTGGKGRQDRTWHSPAGAGLYCTLIVRPKQPQRFWPLLTHVASIALVEALRGLWDQHVFSSPLDADIKWPNDVLLSNKKCAGILLEALWDDARSAAALIGFGVNVHEGSVPIDLTGNATCVDAMAHTRVPRRKLLVQYLRHFQICYLMFEQGRHADVLEQWKRRSSMWTGTHVFIGKGEGRREAVTCGLSSLGALMVRNADGNVETLLAEDVSVSRN